MRASTDLGAAALDIIEPVALTDHDCHGVIERPLVRAEFEDLITESDRPAPAGCSVFDSQLGLAVPAGQLQSSLQVRDPLPRGGKFYEYPILCHHVPRSKT